jgi:hypothetical protein
LLILILSENKLLVGGFTTVLAANFAMSCSGHT